MRRRIGCVEARGEDGPGQPPRELSVELGDVGDAAADDHHVQLEGVDRSSPLDMPFGVINGKATG